RLPHYRSRGGLDLNPVLTVKPAMRTKVTRMRILSRHRGGVSHLARLRDDRAVVTCCRRLVSWPRHVPTSARPCHVKSSMETPWRSKACCRISEYAAKSSMLVPGRSLRSTNLSLRQALSLRA